VELYTALALLALAAYGPPILFAVSIARAKRYRREPGGAVAKAFLWGATGAAGIALFVNTFVQGAFVRPAVQTEALAALMVAVVVAPLVEETVKPLVLYMGRVRRNCDELMDGLIYGGVAGLGFAATENLLYEGSALVSQGAEGFLATAIARTFSATLLHALASAIVGYGIAVHLNTPRGFGIVFPFYMLAVIIHAGYNGVVSIAPGLVILPLVLIIILGFLHLRRRIGEMSLIPKQPDWYVLDRPPAEERGSAESGTVVQEQAQEPAGEPPPPEEWHPVADDERGRSPPRSF
jgi:protease PrsW